MRLLKLAIAATAVALIAAPAMAQQYPSRPINLIVAFPAGGSTDIGARVVAGIAVEPRIGKREGHDGGVLELAMRAVGDDGRDGEIYAGALRQFDDGMRAVIARTAARAAPGRRERHDRRGLPARRRPDRGRQAPDRRGP